jgi:hypothetical protein
MINRFPGLERPGYKSTGPLPRLLDISTKLYVKDQNAFTPNLNKPGLKPGPAYFLPDPLGILSNLGLKER